MAPRPTFEVDSWDAALELVGHVVPDTEVTVSKRAEPILPPQGRGLEQRRCRPAGFSPSSA